MPAITKPNQHFDVLTWSGTNGSNRTLTGLQFQPDFVWAKSRSDAYSHVLWDVVRGAGANKELYSDLTQTEGGTGSTATQGFLSAFTSDGFSTDNGSADTNLYFNASGDTYVSWQWKAGGAAVTNNSGTITSQVSVNPTAGFSVVAWTGNGSASATVGHGLGAVPAMIICKERSGTDAWHVKHKSLATTVNAYLNTTYVYTAAQVGDGMLGDLNSNTTFGFVTAGSPGNVVAVNENGITNIAYCWSEIPGYSSFGSYTGNGSADGTFVYTGFRPRWIMIKQTSSSGEGWYIVDTSRDTYNSMGTILIANDAGADNTSQYPYIDCLSNGFKLRRTWTGVNGSGSTYIYAAFAESPFKYASAR
jgi:hypothetical protein